MTLHLLKLCVGAEGPEDLAGWQAGRPDRWGGVIHVTRMRPRREAELLAGGSLYWVMKGAIVCRQKLISLQEVIGDDGIRRCAIVMNREIIRTRPSPRRPFQGWRYLEPADAPADEGPLGADAEDLPEELRRALAEIGVL
ncbi:DUF1489 domain-containing protein [Pikeienuella sp. HZG-20]|uniref:DUF1489 family protein n=1 Tax=Paludibacillus litoralis TaxID=3133267 RepID=UPI0030EF724A